MVVNHTPVTGALGGEIKYCEQCNLEDGTYFYYSYEYPMPISTTIAIFKLKSKHNATNQSKSRQQN